MISRKRHRFIGFPSSLKIRWSMALVAAIFAGSSIASQLSERVIKFDNSRGTETLEFREHLRQRQCVATVEPDFFTVAPGETAEVRMDVRDSQSSGCLGEPKHVLWDVASPEQAGRPIVYKVLFSVEPKMDGDGRVRIASTKLSRPGTPYAATCGDHACLDEWVPQSGNDNTVFLYPRN
ncbi:hypothetical protein AB1286_05030 [Trinickia sp. NRRL B-1857]|uniref:hypothetical protein n=1 Tax=Trinickia sp. NRRL B-1857 TaxID=3162879 RepID=UPI003D273C43